MSSHKKTQKIAVQNTMPVDDPVPPYDPSLEEIEARAYQRYVQRGRIDGFDVDDWLQAEKELKENGTKRSG